MTISRMTTMAAMMGWTAAALAQSGQPKQKLTVDIYINTHDDSSILLGPGKPMASAIFEKIGVRVNWHDGELGTTRSTTRTDSSHPAFGIRTVEHAPQSATPGALAAAQLLDNSGTEITVYRDRVRRFLADHPSLPAVAAGYVLAHELAHVMQGIPRHSDSGILKAHWSREDYQEMTFHKLAFTSSDVDLIAAGLNSRAARQAALVAAR
jgi:hypothetical protein